MQRLGEDQRHDIERNFHDGWAKGIDIKDVFVIESFESVIALENRAILRFFGDVKGKKILDLGCGAGEASVYFALKGAEVTSLDLSKEMLNKVEALAAHYGVTVKTIESPAEHLPFESDTFDYVYGYGVLHHVNLRMAVHEVSRVLKKEGKAAFIEPLSYNPLISAYRILAREVRTPTETSFRLRDFKFIKQYFNEVQQEFCWFTTLGIFLYMFFIERISPVRDRYWKRVIRERHRYEKMFQRLDRFDQAFLKIFPFMKYFCWTIVIELSQKTAWQDAGSNRPAAEVGGS